MKAAFLALTFLCGPPFAWAVDEPDLKYGVYWARESAAANSSAPNDKLSLIAFPEAKSPDVPYPIFPVVLSNRTKDTISLPSCDQFLYIVQEAQDARGRWRPIEPLPSSWCGNSYFDVQLKAGQAWTLMGIRHSGTFKTKLRFKLNGTTPIYSNEFDGSIDSAQFNVPESEMELVQARILKERKEAERQSNQRKKP